MGNNPFCCWSHSASSENCLKRCVLDWLGWLISQCWGWSAFCTNGVLWLCLQAPHISLSELTRSCGLDPDCCRIMVLPLVHRGLFFCKGFDCTDGGDLPDCATCHAFALGIWRENWMVNWDSKCLAHAWDSSPSGANMLTLLMHCFTLVLKIS